MTPIPDSLIQIPEGIPWVSVVHCTLQYQIVNGTRCSVLSPDVPIDVAHVGGSRAYVALHPHGADFAAVDGLIDVVETQAASMTQPTIRNRGRS
jgi:hypothetical protein